MRDSGNISVSRNIVNDLFGSVQTARFNDQTFGEIVNQSVQSIVSEKSQLLKNAIESRLSETWHSVKSIPQQQNKEEEKLVQKYARGIFMRLTIIWLQRIRIEIVVRIYVML